VLWRENEKEFGWLPWTGAAASVSPETCAVLALGADLAKDQELARTIRTRLEHARAKAGLDKTAASLAYG